MGEILKRLREQRGLTVQGAADALGVVRQTIWTWESDKKPPERAALLAMLKLYGATEDDRAEVGRLWAGGEASDEQGAA